MRSIDERPMVVLLGDTQWFGHRLAAQHIAERLTRYARVLYVDPPLSPIGQRRLQGRYEVGRWAGLHEVAPGLHRLGPTVTPAKTRRGGRRAAETLLRMHLRRAVRSLGGEVRAVVQVPIHFPVLDAIDAEHRVHLASDDFVAAAEQNRVDRAWVERCQDRIGAMATSVMAVSPALVERWRGYGFEPALVPNGSDVELYATTDEVDPAADVTLTPPMAGFIGTLSDRTDVEVLEALADRGRSLLFVGPRSFTAPNAQLDRLFARPNVQWVGPRPYTEVPAYLRHVKVGLVPYRPTEFNQASFPLKTLDYLAAGRAVVSTDLPAVEDVGTDVVTVGATTEAFVEAVERLLDAPDDTDQVRRRRARAAEHSWDRRVGEIAEILGLAAPEPAG